MSLHTDIKAVMSGAVERCAIPGIPYAAFLGLEMRKARSGEGLEIIMPYQESLIGSPQPPRLHGGVVGALLEFAGSIAVSVAAGEASAAPLESLPKPIGMTIEYMRGGATQDMFAHAEILRLGRRIANVRATAWQGDRAKPNASGIMHFLMPGAQD